VEPNDAVGEPVSFDLVLTVCDRQFAHVADLARALTTPRLHERFARQRPRLQLFAECFERRRDSGRLLDRTVRDLALSWFPAVASR
jgi:hypothetical protein